MAARDTLDVCNDIIRKTRDISGVGELMQRQAFLCICENQARSVEFCRLAGKICFHFHEGELYCLQEK